MRSISYLLFATIFSLMTVISNNKDQITTPQLCDNPKIKYIGKSGYICGCFKNAGMFLKNQHKRFLFGAKIDVNLANQIDLLMIDGIGVSLSKRILRLRKSLGGFKDLDQLIKVRGIGQKRFNRIKRFLTVQWVEQ